MIPADLEGGILTVVFDEGRRKRLREALRAILCDVALLLVPARGTRVRAVARCCFARKGAVLADAGEAAPSAFEQQSPSTRYHLKNTDFVNLQASCAFARSTRPFRPCISNTVTLPRGDYVHRAYFVSQRHRTNPDLGERDAPRSRPGPRIWTCLEGGTTTSAARSGAATRTRLS